MSKRRTTIFAEGSIEVFALDNPNSPYAEVVTHCRACGLDLARREYDIRQPHTHQTLRADATRDATAALAHVIDCRGKAPQPNGGR